jgi:hypothetical protein
MSNIDVSHHRKSRTQMSVRRGGSRLEQLVGDPRERANDHHRVRVQSAPYDVYRAANGGPVLHRRASELHYDHIVASLESALPLESLYLSTHILLRFSISSRKEKPTARSLLAVGSGDSLKSALLHPIPSSRRHVVIRVDMPVPVDVIRVSFWMRVFIKMLPAAYRNYKLQSTPGACREEIQNSDTNNRNFIC